MVDFNDIVTEGEAEAWRTLVRVYLQYRERGIESDAALAGLLTAHIYEQEGI